MPERYCVVDDSGKITRQPANPLKSKAIESQQQAKHRRDAQGRVWSDVWRRKLWYLVTLVLALVYISFPTLAKFDGLKFVGAFPEALDYVMGGVGDVLRTFTQVLGTLPGLGMIDKWARSYHAHPYVFALGPIIILALNRRSRTIASTMSGKMRQAWLHLSKDSPSSTQTSSSYLSSFTDSRLIHDGAGNVTGIRWCGADKVQYVFRWLTELLAVLFLTLVVFLVIWRFFYLVEDYAGYVCTPEERQAESRIAEKPVAIKFDSKMPCQDTGWDVVRGETYELTFDVGKQWQDKSLIADTMGWVEGTPWWAYPGSIFKRHLSKDWYAPIVRIGNDWNARWSLADFAHSTRPVNSATMTIQANRSDRLYLYVNDAVSPFQPPFQKIDSTGPNSNENGSRWFFYKNNVGLADVTIRRVDAQVEQGD